TENARITGLGKDCGPAESANTYQGYQKGLLEGRHLQLHRRSSAFPSCWTGPDASYMSYRYKACTEVYPAVPLLYLPRRQYYRTRVWVGCSLVANLKGKYWQLVTHLGQRTDRYSSHDRHVDDQCRCSVDY